MAGVEVFAVYLFKTWKLVLLKPDESLEISLNSFDFELLTVSPVKALPAPAEKSVQFAPIGLVNMLNTGGAVQEFKFTEKHRKGMVAEIAVKGTGEMKAFSSEKPMACRLNGEEVLFGYEDNLVCIQVPWSGSSSKASVIEYSF
ncbi:hypothetical protein J5N97_027639 [Dioscorea zingiberensis]|uniref:Uncharacterized protein n=1 Tax=Dioscorea zingiberensis TaxID=325984 RepID=A0A9D5BXI1_9LILI|nr:hypothetical protein J5N97_027639 [Dioscorea zingiberensis]